MSRQISMRFFNLILFAICVNFMNNCCFACGTEDCPIDCENQYKCSDRSELCEQLKHQCENYFFRKCMRCACPKTCGVCGRHNDEANDEGSLKITTASSSTSILTILAFSTPEFTFSTENSSTSPFLNDTTNSTISSTSLSSSTDIFSTTIEVISDEEFKNPAKMKCKSCDAKRKKLAEIYEKYYPKE